MKSEVIISTVRMYSPTKKTNEIFSRKRRNKLELCVKLGSFRLFHFGHVIQNRRSALSLA